MPLTRCALSGRAPRDEGSALIITMMVMVLVGIIATSVATVTVRNLQSSNLARSAGVAVDAANAGISQGVSYLRANGVVAVQACPAPAPTVTDPTATAFTAFDLGSQTCVQGLNDAAVRPVNGQPYSVLIATRTDYATGHTGKYQIVARGTGPVRASRVVTAEVDARGSALPAAAMQANSLGVNGTQTIDGQGVFVKGCVTDRARLTMTGTDAFGLPAAVHSESSIGRQNSCSSNLIHPPACNTTDSGRYKYDQDRDGGPVGSACLPATPGSYYANGSKLAVGDLERVYGIKFPPLADEDIAQLRTIAVAQGNLRTNANVNAAFTPNGTHAVVFYDITSGVDVDLSNIHGFGWTGTCPDRSLVVIIKGASQRWTASTAPLMASVFVVTAGKEWYNSGGGIIGSVYADRLTVGGAAVYPDAAWACANNRTSPSTMTFSVTSYRELDG